PLFDSEGNLIGAIESIRDITERKQVEKQLMYLSLHDSLTGLYNRAFFEEELKRLDTARNYPISIIMSDVNGLKLTNDIFGHAAGDKLLRKVAQILKQACRADDIIARIGGDEFVILLPKTTLKEAEAVALRIKNEYAKENVNAVKASISMGCAVKESAGEDIFHVLHTAEDKMYLDKTLNRKNIDRNLIKTIMDTLHKNNPREKEHSQRVSALCEKIGEAMHLPAEKIKMIKDAGFYHDIGKIAWDAGLFNKEGQLTEQEQQELKQHPVVGYRILNSFEDTMNLAEIVLAHHEKWDGSGYPKGLKGQEIPELARILAVAESFDAMTRDGAGSEKEAVREIKRQAGLQFDPVIAALFAKAMDHDETAGMVPEAEMSLEKGQG
ncbi:MAG TPA: diguanylate cyclase, partial [Bacillota bacterium]|nr:diguanylate cyclase [Bacillota bacterium]